MPKDFTLADFKKQMQQLRKMGTKELRQMMPGTSDTDIEDLDSWLNRTSHMIDAMTDAERSKPDIINSERRAQLAAASGAKPEELERLLETFEQMQALMREINRMNLP